MTTKREMVATFAPGDTVTVTNHWITRPDHPCYGTRTDRIVRINEKAITFEIGGRSEWPTVDQMETPEPGRLILFGRPDGTPGPFLEIRKEER